MSAHRRICDAGDRPVELFPTTPWGWVGFVVLMLLFLWLLWLLLGVIGSFMKGKDQP